MARGEVAYELECPPDPSRGICVVGAGGHGRVIADVAREVGYRDVVFLDDDPSVTECAGWPVIGDTARLGEAASSRDAFVAVGNWQLRRNVLGKLGKQGVRLPVLIHPAAVIAQGVRIGAGSAVMAGAVVGPGTSVGRGAILNTRSSVDHDCMIGDWAHVCPGATLAGGVSVGGGAWIGVGATVSNCVRICPGAVLGAGAVVVRDIGAPGTYVGVPARPIEG